MKRTAVISMLIAGFFFFVLTAENIGSRLTNLDVYPVMECPLFGNNEKCSFRQITFAFSKADQVSDGEVDRVGNGKIESPTLKRSQLKDY